RVRACVPAGTEAEQETSPCRDQGPRAGPEGVFTGNIGLPLLGGGRGAPPRCRPLGRTRARRHVLAPDQRADAPGQARRRRGLECVLRPQRAAFLPRFGVRHGGVLRREPERDVPRARARRPRFTWTATLVPG